MKRSPKGGGSRRTTSPINVWCMPAERAEIEANAKAAGLSLSAYLRAVGVGCHPRSVVDYDQVALMARAHADLNRLGGVLKMWLTNKERMRPQEVCQLLEQIKQSNYRLSEAAERIIRSK